MWTWVKLYFFFAYPEFKKMKDGYVMLLFIFAQAASPQETLHVFHVMLSPSNVNRYKVLMVRNIQLLRHWWPFFSAIFIMHNLLITYVFFLPMYSFYVLFHFYKGAHDVFRRLGSWISHYTAQQAGSQGIQDSRNTSIPSNQGNQIHHTNVYSGNTPHVDYSTAKWIQNGCNQHIRWHQPSYVRNLLYQHWQFD